MTPRWIQILPAHGGRGRQPGDPLHHKLVAVALAIPRPAARLSCSASSHTSSTTVISEPSSRGCGG
jgi:hypothetical protein